MKGVNHERIVGKITASVIDTDEGDSAELAQEALDQGIDVFAIVDALTAGINELGRQFENLECFLPELILGGGAMEEAMKILSPEIEKHVQKSEAPICLVVGNLQGDIHDIGREILCTMLRVAGFTVHDLGNNVKANVFVEKAIEYKADFIGLSSLLTTSLPFAKDGDTVYMDKAGAVFRPLGSNRIVPDTPFCCKAAAT